MKAKKRKSRRKQKQRQKKKPLRFLFYCLVIGLLLATAYHRFGFDQLSWEAHPAPAGRVIENTLELQIALARQGFSPGSIDGVMGSQTRQALAAFHASRGLPATGELDPSLQDWLRIKEPTHAYVELTTAALAQLSPRPSTWRERGQLSYLGYHSVLEMVAEKTRAAPDYIRAINPQVDWSGLGVGDRILAPLVPAFRIEEPIDRIEIQLQQRQLQVFDAAGNLVFHCPASIARDVDKRPVGELKIKVRVEKPNYTFNPNILRAAAEREGITGRFIIQPGPNNPVGTVWLGLNRPSYGIHGTPAPEQVGRTESSGCFRLANWNAETLLHATEVGTPVIVLP